jgi:hypothetical protein
LPRLGLAEAEKKNSGFDTMLVERDCRGIS